MASVLPGSPPGFRRDDLAGSVRALCGYMRTLQENVDFALGQQQRRLDAAEGAMGAMQETMAALKNALKERSEG